jgi:hypothetical protein
MGPAELASFRKQLYSNTSYIRMFCVKIFFSIAFCMVFVLSPISAEAVNLEKRKACTREAKICPDGSAVGRSGPNCEFAPCPEAKPDMTMCPMDAMMCPDGRYVGRSGPNCEFDCNATLPDKIQNK